MSEYGDNLQKNCKFSISVKFSCKFFKGMGLTINGGLGKEKFYPIYMKFKIRGSVVAVKIITLTLLLSSSNTAT